MTVHQLVSHLGDPAKGAPPWTITARCGATVIRRPGEPFPENFTAWASRVTCNECSTGVDTLALVE